MNNEMSAQGGSAFGGKNKKGNVAIIAVIIVIVAITAGVIGYLFAKKTQTPAAVPVVTQPAPVAQAPVAQPVVQPTNQQIVPSEIDSDNSFDIIANADKMYSPCDNKYEKVDPIIGKKIKDFYNALKIRDLNTAIGLMQQDENNLLPYIFPICSALHKPLAYKAGNSGITMFILSGNGYPSVPNDSYSFGHIWVSGNKILLRESIVSHYFDGNLGAEYQKDTNNGAAVSSDRAIEILDKLEADTKKGIETGIFANAAMQKEYNEFIASLK